jgi:hypothetical protein
MDKVQKTIGSQCYIPSSEPFRTNDTIWFQYEKCDSNCVILIADLNIKLVTNDKYCLQASNGKEICPEFLKESWSKLTLL